jgi:hypothetical protein
VRLPCGYAVATTAGSAGRTYFAHSPRREAALRKPERRPLVDVLLTWRRQGDVDRAQRTNIR